MLQSLSEFLRKRTGAAWEEADARHFVQTWLREKTKTQQLYCERFQDGVALVRAISPAVRMVVKLAEYDLQQALTEAGGPKLKEVRVVR